MKLLCFQARRFWWKSFSKTLDEVEEQEAGASQADSDMVAKGAEEINKNEWKNKQETELNWKKLCTVFYRSEFLNKINNKPKRNLSMFISTKIT